MVSLWSNKKNIMREVLVISIIGLFFFACTDTSKNESKEKDIAFDQSKWKLKEDMDYLYRSNMLNDVIKNEDLRRLKKDELLDVLGQPDYYRDDSSYLYYRISETRLAYWKLHTRTLVIKMSEDSTVTWMKIHE